MHTTGCSVDWEKISLTSCIGSQLIDEKVAFPFRTMTGLIYSSFMFFTFWQWGSLSLHRSFQTCKPYRHHRVDAVCSTQVSSHCCRYVTFLDIVNNYTGGKLYKLKSTRKSIYTSNMHVHPNYQYDIPQNTIHRWKPGSFESYTNVSSFKDPTWWMILGG